MNSKEENSLKTFRLLSQLHPRIRPLYAAHLYGGRERGDLPDSPMGALEENYQDLPLFQLRQEFGLCMRHICMVGEREVISLIVPWERRMKTIKTFVPITSKNLASVCGTSVWWERGDLPDSPMGALEENYQDSCPNYLQEFGLCMRHLYGEREVISLIVPWERWRKTIKTYFCFNYTSKNSASVCGICMVVEREVISLMVPWERWRKTIKTFVSITSKNSASVCGICMVGER